MKKLPKTLEKLILFIEAEGLDWAIAKRTKEDTHEYWAEISHPEKSDVSRSQGHWSTSVDALKDAYARFTASNYKPIAEQLGFPPRQKRVGKGNQEKTGHSGLKGEKIK